MTTDQPADLDAIRRALTHYDETGSDDVAHDLVADVPALVGEVERLRATNETLLNQLGDAAARKAGYAPPLAWDDVANQMEAGTYRPANPDQQARICQVSTKNAAGTLIPCRSLATHVEDDEQYADGGEADHIEIVKSQVCDECCHCPDAA